MMRRAILSVCVLAALPALAWADLPKVVLLGDSIPLGYAPLVAKRLEGKAIVVSPKGAGDSAWLLKQVDLVVKEKPAVVHFNVGPHDLRKSRKAGSYQVELSAYEANVK